MEQRGQRTSMIEAAGRIIRDLVARPNQVVDESANDDGSTIFAEPLPTELPIENGKPSLIPSDGYLQDGIQFLKGRTIWAVDGGILPWQFPNGVLLIGRAVVSRLSFNGYETVQRVFDVPLVPFVVYPQVESQGASSFLLETLTRDYLQYILGSIPSGVASPASTILPFTDTEQFIASLPDSYYAGSATKRGSLMQYIDHIRNAAETVAFVYALRAANSKDIVMRDGRIHGGAGFLTGFVKEDQNSDDRAKGISIVRDVIRSIRDAVDHGVRVVGIIKHPSSNYCTQWYVNEGRLDSAKYVASDAMLYYRTIEPRLSERTRMVYGAGKRSCLWQIRESGYGKRGERPVDIENSEGRELVHWFYQNTGAFFLKPKEGVLPIRVDFILHNDHYRSWFADNLTEQIYSLCTGSGSPIGLPQPIVIADGYAKVHRPELARSIEGLIAYFENSASVEDMQIGRELRAYLDIYFRGGN